jgi:hypothetical protein
MIEIIAVENRKQRNQFVDFLYKLNQADKNWVPPLRVSERANINQKKHPFYNNVEAHFYLAIKSGQTVGRIASIFNKNNSKGYFGFLQAIKDQAVFNALFRQVEEDLSAHDCSSFTGPVSPSINYEMGVLVDGFNTPPFLMLAHNYRYYDELIKASGFEKAKDFYSYYADKNEVVLPEKIARVKDTIEARYNVKLHNPDMSKFPEEAKKIEEVYNNAMAEHWGFVPMDSVEFQNLASELKQIIDPKMVFIAEINSEPVGFMMGLPNINEIFKKNKGGRLFPTGFLNLLYYRKKVKGLRVITLGIKKKYQPLGIGSVMYYHIILNFLKSNYENVEHSWVMEDNNPVVKISELIGLKRYKTYRVYQKKINLNG